MTISIFSDAYKKEGNKTTPLHTAIIQGLGADEISMLIKNGASVDAKNEDGQTPLMLAAQHSNVPAVQILLQHGARASSPNDAGLTALHFAVHAPEVMQLLLAQKSLIDPRAAGRTPLSYAAEKGTPEVVKMLLDAGAQVNLCDESGKTPLFYAQNIEIMQRLLSAGADLAVKDNQGNTVLAQAVHNRETDNISFLAQHGAGGNELVAAVDDCNLELVQALLAYGISPDVQNTKGERPLHAVFAYHPPRSWSNPEPKPVEHQPAIFDLLLAKGADVNVQDTIGSTPLMLAIGSKLKDKVVDLLKKGARVDIKNNDKETALHYAVEENNSAALKLLIKAGADLNAQDKYGRTPLHIAAEMKKNGAVKLLVESGANIYIKDANGKTPYTLAQSSRAAELEALLKGNQE